MERNRKTIITLLMTLVYFIVYSNDNKVEVGDTISSFTAVDENGDLWNSVDLKGRILVIYFYPAAMTGGCTKQACSYRDNRGEIMDLGAEIIGVSGDEPQNLKLFKDAYNLNFTLLSDTEGKVAKLFGVPVKQGKTITKEVNGKQYKLTRKITTSRWTFVISTDGEILYRSTDVIAAQDSDAVIEVLQKYTDK